VSDVCQKNKEKIKIREKIIVELTKSEARRTRRKYKKIIKGIKVSKV
jgi:hypothetical protein